MGDGGSINLNDLIEAMSDADSDTFAEAKTKAVERRFARALDAMSRVGEGSSSEES